MAIMEYVHILRFVRNLRSGELLMSTTIVLWSVTQSTTVNFLVRSGMSVNKISILLLVLP